MRYDNWLRWRIPQGTDPAAAAALMPAGRKLLGTLMRQLELSGNLQGLMRQTLPDGSTLVARFDGTTPMVEMTLPTTAGETTEETYNLWVPRGFVTYPATTGHPYGVGLPVLPVGSLPYQRENLSPGLDWDRWTDDGALGEVLLSRDPDAGYPTDTARETAPLLYSDAQGPVFRWDGHSVGFDTRAPLGPWKAYRIEFRKPDATGAVMFEDINAHRHSLGLDPLVLWPRGWYRYGQVTAEILATNGFAHHSRAFPATYQTSWERAAKDGYVYDMSLGVNTPPAFRAPLAGEPDPYPSWFTIQNYGRAHVYGPSENIAQAAGPDDAFSQWLASPPHKANIEDTNWNGARTWFDGGGKNGVFVQGFGRKAAWIQAGNGQFQSAHADLPPLTWHTFASMSLAFETWPVTWNGTTLAKATDFTVPGNAAGDGGGGCWLSYPRTPKVSDTDADNPCDVQVPALGRHLFMRGRAIALAPRGGLILGAGIQRHGTTDRVIALVHHVEDQSTDWTEGMTRYLRVWWADVPARALGLDPAQTICGEGSDSYNTLPWRGGDLVDVGTIPDAPLPALETSDPRCLKYSALWRFAPDGSEAVCLRDYMSVAQYASFFAGATSTTILTGGYQRALRLVFDRNGDGSLMATPQWEPWIFYPNRTVASIPGVLTATAAGQSITEYSPVPLAVDYDASGTLQYAFLSVYSFTATDNLPVVVRLVGVGGGSVRGGDGLTHRAVADTQYNGLPECDFQMSFTLPLVADVVDGAFVLEGARSRTVYPDGWTVSGADSELNPEYVVCKAFTDVPVHGLRLLRGGALVAEGWYPCPDGVVFDLWHLCDPDSATGEPGVALVLPAAALMAQAYYARRGADWVFAAPLSPQPGVVQVRDDEAPDNAGTHHCDCQTSIDDYASRTHVMARAELAPRGGKVVANFDLPTGANDGWFFNAKAV